MNATHRHKGTQLERRSLSQLLTTFSAADGILGRGPSDTISPKLTRRLLNCFRGLLPPQDSKLPSLTSLLFISLIITIDYYPQQPRMSSNTFGASTLTFAPFFYLDLCKKRGLGLLLT